MADEARGAPVPEQRWWHAVPWRLVGVMVAAVTVGGFIWWHAAGPGARAGSDFGAYLAGARAVAAGQNPYHNLVTQTVETTAGDSGLHAHGYVYPPLLALVLAVPLRLGLSDTTVWLLWTLANVAALVWMGWELQRFLVPVDPSLSAAWRQARAWAGALAFAAACLLPAIVTYDLWLGQADLLMAALVVGAGGLWLRRNPWAALVLAVAIAIKPTMALVLLVWLWKGDWRVALRGATVAVGLVALSFAAVGLAALHDYVIFFMQWNAFRANAEYINQSPYGMLLRIFTRNPYTQPLIILPWVVTPLRLVAMGGAVWLWARVVPRQRSADPAVGMSELLLALPLIVLLSPLAEDIHFCVLVPTLVGFAWLAWQRGLAHRPAAWVLWGALALSCIPRMQELIYPTRFVPLPLQSDPHIGPFIALLRTGTLLYIAVAVLVAGGAVLGKEERSSAVIAVRCR